LVRLVPQLRKEQIMALVLIHGSWHNGAVWQKVEHLLTPSGMTVYAPTLSGFTSRHTPAGKDVGLALHIHDMVTLIQNQHLSRVVLVGHSYGGMVITGVAEQVPERLAALVYLDAFIPADGQSLADLQTPETVAHWQAALVDAQGRSRADGVTDGWLLPPSTPQDYGVTAPVDVAWLSEQMVYTPMLTFTEGVRVTNPQARAIPRYFIRCSAFPYLNAEQRKAEAAGWPIYGLPAGHDAMVTHPAAVAGILTQILDDTEH
jgi:pimeloyl-ACP methyl ester carboxylesterase